jgi:hypothetical protein
VCVCVCARVCVCVRVTACVRAFYSFEGRGGGRSWGCGVEVVIPMSSTCNTKQMYDYRDV